jgi:hypothetical protein
MSKAWYLPRSKVDLNRQRGAAAVQALAAATRAAHVFAKGADVS